MVHSELATAIGTTLGLGLQAQPAARVHGGSINECYRWRSSAGEVFVKVAPLSRADMLSAEAAGLRQLACARAVRVPQVLGTGSGNSVAWLALEWINSSADNHASDALLGERLARQHAVTQAAFGWYRDNTIGSTPQSNSSDTDWLRFLREQRLRYQLTLAAGHGYTGQLQDRGALLLEKLGELFRTYLPAPALLHGDLWSGNRLTAAGGEPVIVDPAVYFGDREADVAMTRLFGGFGVDFYAAYQSAAPLADGADVRVDLYNLYHVLNHLNLFGEGYRAQALSLIDRLLAQMGH